MRQSYTVTVPEEPPSAAFPFLKQEMRRKGSMSGSMLVSTFVGLLINQAKVRARARCVPLYQLGGERHSGVHSENMQFNHYYHCELLLLFISYWQSFTTHQPLIKMLYEYSGIKGDIIHLAVGYQTAATQWWIGWCLVLYHLNSLLTVGGNKQLL